MSRVGDCYHIKYNKNGSYLDAPKASTIIKMFHELGAAYLTSIDKITGKETVHIKISWSGDVYCPSKDLNYIAYKFDRCYLLQNFEDMQSMYNTFIGALVPGEDKQNYKQRSVNSDWGFIVNGNIYEFETKDSKIEKIGNTIIIYYELDVGHIKTKQYDLNEIVSIFETKPDDIKYKKALDANILIDYEYGSISLIDKALNHKIIEMMSEEFEVLIDWMVNGVDECR